MAERPPLWACPRCGAKLISRNLWHACGPYTIEGFLQGKGPKARALFHRFESLLKECGPIIAAPAKTRVAFMVRVRFAGVTQVSERGMTCGFALLRRIDSPRFAKVTKIGKWYAYRLRVTSPEELDDEVLDWLRESYDVGTQKHLGARGVLVPPRKD